MSRATELAKLSRAQVLAEWVRQRPGVPGTLAAWAAQYATKEQLVDQIVTEEERAQRALW